MKFRFLLLAVILLYSINLFSQYSLKELIAREKEKPFTEREVDSILNTFKTQDIAYAKVVHNFSYFFKKAKRNFPLAIKYGVMETDIYEKHQLDNADYSNALYNLGNFHYFTNDLDTAIAYFQQAIQSNQWPLKTGQSYCMIARCYRKKGEFYKALDYYHKGLPIIKIYDPKASYIFHSTLLAATCYSLDTPKSTKLALNYLKSADSIVKHPSSTNKVHAENIMTLYSNIGALYTLGQNKNYKKAKHYYQKTIALAEKDKNNIYISFVSNNLAELYLNANNDSCFSAINKSIAHDKKKFFFYESQRILSNYLLKKKQYNKALEAIQIAIKHNFRIENSDDFSTENKQKFLNARNQSGAFKSFITKIQILLSLYKEQQNEAYLQRALKTVEQASYVANIIIKHSTEADTRFLWKREIDKLYKLGIQVAYRLNSPQLMVSFMETNKALLLASDIKNNDQFLQLPKSTVELYKSLKKQLFTLENTIKSEETPSSALRDSLFSLKNRFQQLRKEVESEYHTTLEFSDDITTINLPSIQQALQENETIVYYSLIDSQDIFDENQLIGLMISATNTYFFEISSASTFNDNLNSFKKFLKKPLKTKSQFRLFEKTAHQVFKNLFPENTYSKYIKNKKVTLITDTQLDNIAFEALNISPNRLSYLVNSTTIHYAYSMSFNQFNRGKIRTTQSDYSSFTPEDFASSKLAKLPYSIHETTPLVEKTNGHRFTKNQASKTNFLNNTEYSKILHLATHASTEGEPTIYFQKDSMNLHELYSYKNNADLVVLSACETNLGAVKNGEGVLNLARGFFYSGANSVVSSLWKVNNQSTANIMVDFYKNLTNHQSKATALTQAKRAYLKTHTLSEQSPFYWASFVLIGNAEPTFKKSLTPWIIIGASILLFLLIGMVYKRLKTYNSK